jgi:alpha-D-ribose 1-methylphosphonate 5-phosphate C-P lyase
VTDEQGGRMFMCSDTDYCEVRRGRAQDAGQAESRHA